MVLCDKIAIFDNVWVLKIFGNVEFGVHYIQYFLGQLSVLHHFPIFIHELNTFELRYLDGINVALGTWTYSLICFNSNSF